MTDWLVLTLAKALELPWTPLWWLFSALLHTLVLSGVPVEPAIRFAWPIAALADWLQTPGQQLRTWWVGREIPR